MAVQTPKILCSQCNVAAQMPDQPSDTAAVVPPHALDHARTQSALDFKPRWLIH